MSTTGQSMKQTTQPDEQRYWLSLRDKEQTTEYRELLAREFPEGTTELAGSMDRRRFLTLMGASLALAGLTSCRRPEEHIVPYVSRPEEVMPGNIARYATSMPLGVENYPLLIDSREGRPVKAAGNPLVAATGSSSNVWANASVLELYDPDRAQQVSLSGEASSTNAFTAAWSALHATYTASQGEGLALLTTSFASPTLHRLLLQFRAAFPLARVAVYEPVCDRAIVEGSRLAFGSPLKPEYAFSAADVVVALDADFLGTDSRSAANAAGFAAKRRVARQTDVMNRLYLVESSLSQTSAMADHRLRLPASQVPAFLGALARALQAQGLALPQDIVQALPAQGPSFDALWVNTAAGDLIAARGRSVLLAGRGQAAAVHALVAAINLALDNVGSTVFYKPVPYAAGSDPESLAALARDMNDGKVAHLCILGGNPVYNAPGDLDFRRAMEKTDVFLHHSLYVDETSSRAQWHVPKLHYLEHWGDAVGLDGYLGVIQPLIAPLWTGMSDVEMLHLLATGTARPGYDIVRETFAQLKPEMNDADWRRLLHDGMTPMTITPEAVSLSSGTVADALRKLPAAPALSLESMEVVFRLSPVVHDGRYANLGWLQEFPDPVTKITWDNAALMSAETARQLGVDNGSLVRLRLGERDVPMPVWIMPGQAEYSVTVMLGYGRERAGRIGTGVGFNASRIRPAASPYMATGLLVGAAFGSHAIACVQDHHGLDAEDMARSGVQERLPQIIREATLEEYRNHPEFAKEVVEHPPLRSMWDDHTYDEGHQWGMSIDLNACTGCGACTVACQSENNIPIVGKEQVLNGREMHWIRIDRYYAGDVEEPDVRVQPVGCVHCEMAPCEQVCPVAATSHDEEGLNVMTYNRCIGTRYCSNNCPYKVRRFNFYNYTKDLPETVQMAQNPDVTVRFRGVMEKCTYCTQRITRGKITAKNAGRELRDGDIQAACEQSCPTQAIVFGDINDPESRVAKQKARDRDYALLSELNLRPRTTYLARLSNPHPALAGRGNDNA